MLIYNADDYCLNIKESERITELSQYGIIKSTTIVSNNPTLKDYINKIKYSGLSIGIHINLVEGKPLSNSSSLVDEDGNFFSKKDFVQRLFLGKIDYKEIEKEISLQFEYLLDNGIYITHIDSHQNTHLFMPVLNAIIKAAEKFKVKKIRGQKFISNWFMETNSVKYSIRDMFSFLWQFRVGKKFKFANEIIINTPGLGIKIDNIDKAIKLWEYALRCYYNPNIIYEVPCHLGLSDLEYDLYKSESFLSMLKRINIKIGSYHDI